MVVEHIGIAVTKPFEMAKWYRDNLGFNILFSSEGDVKSNEMAFISDDNSSIIIEVFKSPNQPSLQEVLEDPIQFHIAFVSENIEQDCKRLVDHGAVFVEKQPEKHKGEILMLFRDPFGNTIQLVKRGEAIHLK